MEMCYDGNLVMPNNFVQMDSDEMEYLEGGFYISNSQLVDILGATVLSGAITLPAISAAMTSIQAGITLINPIVGVIVGVVGVYALRNLPGAIFDAAMQKKGIDVGLKYTSFGLPYDIDWTVK